MDTANNTSTNKEETSTAQSPSPPSNLFCFSHLRWDFVFQRPQHLLTRFARQFNVYYMEEPMFDAQGEDYFAFEERAGLSLLVPHLPQGISREEAVARQKNMLDKLFLDKTLDDYIFWYYTPMALSFSGHYDPALVIYDCMDELSAFKFAPPELKDLENQLLRKADIVFTGGYSLYEAKKHQHKNIFPFPSSIDSDHFGEARKANEQPADQASIPEPKIGYFGVIDERFDIDLVRDIASARPEWNIILIGPVIKIDPALVPVAPNIHYLGPKNYKELPRYLSGWDIALIPFLINEATRFISPTKTPEYLAAGIPVISTPIRDVVSPYGEAGLVEIAGDAVGFVQAAEKLLVMNKQKWVEKVDEALSKQSWNLTFREMLKELNNTLKNKQLN